MEGKRERASRQSWKDLRAGNGIIGGRYVLRAWKICQRPDTLVRSERHPKGWEIDTSIFRLFQY
jgi:hypothetical protein